MGKIEFGFDQVTNPTPSKINFWVRVFTIAAAVFLGWMSQTNLIGPVSKDGITQILGLMLGLTNGLAPLFGIELAGKSVPAKDVTAADAP